MSIRKTQFEEQNERMCKRCMIFYGTDACEGCCSSCYKKMQNQKKEGIDGKVVQQQKTFTSPCRKESVDTVEEAVEQPIQKDLKRCFDCNKKVGLLGIKCKCSFVFCNAHRLPQNHKCSFDHAWVGKKKLEKEVVKVYNGKITHI